MKYLAAWALLAAVVGFTLAMVYLNVRLNTWTNRPSDALQAKEASRVYAVLLRLCPLAGIYKVLAVYGV